jgi:diaminopimelate decarboxylase
MLHFSYQNNQLCAEKIPFTDIAKQFGTPCYVYSHAALTENWHAFSDAFGAVQHRICYAVKANSNLAILNLFARHQSGFDIVSQGELERVLAAGGDPKKIVFSGVGKKPAEIFRALEVGIHCFNVESESELQRIHALAKQKNKIAAIALRINPHIDAGTHPYIATGMKENKFGIEIETVLPLCAAIKNMPHLKLIGIACHIGSQITDLTPFVDAIDRVLELATVMAQLDIKLEHINIGGGLGVTYQDEQLPSIKEYVKTLCEKFAKQPYEIIIEPGRALTANAGILLTQVEHLKHTTYKNFAIVDAAMNDLLRPSLYNAWQRILPVSAISSAEEKLYDIVGPVCESADFLGKDRRLALQPNDLLAVCSAGAYGFSMSSNYNSRPRAAEVMVNQDKMYLIRRRETIAELFVQENIPAMT